MKCCMASSIVDCVYQVHDGFINTIFSRKYGQFFDKTDVYVP